MRGTLSATMEKEKGTRKKNKINWKTMFKMAINTYL